VTEAVDLGPENDEQMARLREALVLGDAFQLVIVHVEPGEPREEVLRRLDGWSGRGGVPRLELVRLAPGESPVTRLVGEPPGVILVGLEADDRVSAARAREMLAELNWSRDRLPQLVRGPLILVISQRVQTALFEQAPDFYSWRMHSTSIVPQAPGLLRASPWLDEDPGNPAEIEASIAGGTSPRSLPPHYRARLHARLALARAARGEFSLAKAALRAAGMDYARAGSARDFVKLYLLGAEIAERRGRLDEAASWLKRARQQATAAAPDRRLATRALSLSSRLSADLDNDATTHEIEETIPASQALGDPGMEAMLVSAQARLILRGGDVAGSIGAWEHSLQLYRLAGDAISEVNALMMLASVHAAAGRSDDAEAHGVAAVARAETSRSLDMVARAKATLARIALDNDHLELAEAMLEPEVPAGSLDAEGRLAEARGHLALRQGRLAAAAHHLRAALAAYQRGEIRWDAAEVSLAIGELGQRSQDWTLACAGFDTAERLGDIRQRALAALGLAELRFDRGERTAALADQLVAATQLLVAAGNATGADTARERRGAVLMALGRDLDARVDLEAALVGFETRGQAESAARVTDQLVRLEAHSRRRISD